MKKPPGYRWFRPETKAFIDEAAKLEGYSYLDWLHGYVYMRWPYLYISMATGEHRLIRFARPLLRLLEKMLIRQNGKKKEYENGGVRVKAADSGDKITFADTYHGKVVPLDAASQLVTIDREIELKDLENIIPYRRARDIIMRHPEHIAVLDCPCRAARDNPCLPLDVCLIIGEPFASSIIAHHPLRSRWITQKEALDILKAEHDRGHVHHAFFKDAMLGRFYAICNCCSCCCSAMQAHFHGIPMVASSGFVTQIDVSRCKSCLTCKAICPFHAIEEGDIPVVHSDACMGCGVCVSKCPEQAMMLVRDDCRPFPLILAEMEGRT